MSLLERRRAARRAELEFELTRVQWHARTRLLREHYARHREAWLLGGGFAAGVIASLLPLRAGVRLGRTLASAASLLLRSPLQTLLFEYVHRHLDRDETTTRTQ
ncbi:hypothetical protein [Dokdonella sp.]|uniref:hypothetical protein n=1 Tax=Dokdonella sp. TaxID=2291710 RepID=UPI001B1FA59D|nr:hypothetical protein [Dokdonella sp.]MBO9664881.1 hypothetical protein [Dokdonella sp.]